MVDARRQFIVALLVGVSLFSMASGITAQEVSVKSEKITIPTYKMGPDEKQPVFRGFKVPGMPEFRAHRSTYPYPRADRFSHEKTDMVYESITMENEFIKVVIIPDLRGRLQGAWDKRNGWDFLYYNHVIKPVRSVTGRDGSLAVWSGTIRVDTDIPSLNG